MNQNCIHEEISSRERLSSMGSVSQLRWLQHSVTLMISLFPVPKWRQFVPRAAVPVNLFRIAWISFSTWLFYVRILSFIRLWDAQDTRRPRLPLCILSGSCHVVHSTPISIVC